MNHFLEALRQELRKTRSPAEAISAVVDKMGSEIERNVRGRRSVADKLTSLGFDSDTAHEVQQAASHTSVEFALRSVISGGSAAGVPTAECLSRHLPTDRDWTDEEMDAAIEACHRESLKVARLA